jgi:hypothetical protein
MVGKARCEIDAVGEAAKARSDHVADAESHQLTVAIEFMTRIGRNEPCA